MIRYLVGVKAQSVNDEAAQYLANRFGFQVNNSFVAYGDVFEALTNGSIDFALVDSILSGPRIGSTVVTFGTSLDSYLTDFYKKIIGYPNERYGVLIYENDYKDTRLRDFINDILNSSEGKTKVIELEKKYHIPDLQTK